jgi:hypothetical protein
MVLGATVALGVVLGVGWALATGPLITRSAVQNLTIGAAPERILVAGVLLPHARGRADAVRDTTV